MLKNLSKGLFLFGALTIATAAPAQSSPSTDAQRNSTDVAVTFIFEHAQVAEINGNRFWPKGGDVNVGVSIWKGVGFAFDLAGEHKSNIQNGINLDKISFMGGPRFSFDLSRSGESLGGHRPARAFVQGLLGPTHAFDSLFPGPNAISTSANALSVQMGGGIDIPWKNGFGIRALEVGWIHSDYSNAAKDIQNDFRIGFGVSYRR
jgi:hypothetical protein